MYKRQINKLIPGKKWDIGEISLAGEREAMQIEPEKQKQLSPAEGAIQGLVKQMDTLKTAAGKGWITLEHTKKG